MYTMRILVITIAFFLTNLAFAETASLHLDPGTSQITFTVDSKLIRTNGKFNDYSGIFLYNSKNIESSKLKIQAKGSGISFGTLPIDQMILVSSLIQSIPNSEVSFESDSIEKQSGNIILVQGTGYAGGKNKGQQITLPLILTSLHNGAVQLQGSYDRNGPIGNKQSPQTALFGDVNTKAQFKLNFK